MDVRGRQPSDVVTHELWYFFSGITTSNNSTSALYDEGNSLQTGPRDVRALLAYGMYYFFGFICVITNTFSLSVTKLLMTIVQLGCTHHGTPTKSPIAMHPKWRGDVPFLDDGVTFLERFFI